MPTQLVVSSITLNSVQPGKSFRLTIAADHEDDVLHIQEHVGTVRTDERMYRMTAGKSQLTTARLSLAYMGFIPTEENLSSMLRVINTLRFGA